MLYFLVKFVLNGQNLIGVAWKFAGIEVVHNFFLTSCHTFSSANRNRICLAWIALVCFAVGSIVLFSNCFNVTHRFIFYLRHLKVNFRFNIWAQIIGKHQLVSQNLIIKFVAKMWGMYQIILKIATKQFEFVPLRWKAKLIFLLYIGVYFILIHRAGSDLTILTYLRILPAKQ